jgi:hypothetical protein
LKPTSKKRFAAAVFSPYSLQNSRTRSDGIQFRIDSYGEAIHTNGQQIQTTLRDRTRPECVDRFASSLPAPALDQIMRSGLALPVCHCLLLDRRDRRAYISQRDQTLILFALTEPEEGDQHTVFVDGLLMSTGSESYRQPVPVEFVDELRRFLDSQTLAPNVRPRLGVER